MFPWMFPLLLISPMSIENAEKSPRERRAREQTARDIKAQVIWSEIDLIRDIKKFTVSACSDPIRSCTFLSDWTRNRSS